MLLRLGLVWVGSWVVSWPWFMFYELILAGVVLYFDCQFSALCRNVEILWGASWKRTSRPLVGHPCLSLSDWTSCSKHRDSLCLPSHAKWCQVCKIFRTFFLWHFMRFIWNTNLLLNDLNANINHLKGKIYIPSQIPSLMCGAFERNMKLYWYLCIMYCIKDD